MGTVQMLLQDIVTRHSLNNIKLDTTTAEGNILLFDTLNTILRLGRL